MQQYGSTGVSPRGAEAFDGALEIRYPAVQRLIVCVACLLAGFLTCFVCFAYLPSPVRYIGLVALGIDVALAFFFWRYFGSFVIRADHNGISRTTLLHTQSVPWSQIDSMKMQYVGRSGAILTLTLEDEDENILLGLRRGFATRPDQQKLLAYIRARMKEVDANGAVTANR